MVPIGEEDLPSPILVRPPRPLRLLCPLRLLRPLRSSSPLPGNRSRRRRGRVASLHAPKSHPKSPVAPTRSMLAQTTRPLALTHTPPPSHASLAPPQGSTAPSHVEHTPGERARVFQGGYYLDLHKMLGVASGSQARLACRLYCMFGCNRWHRGGVFPAPPRCRA